MRGPRRFSLFGVLVLMLGLIAANPALAQEATPVAGATPVAATDVDYGVATRGERLCPVAGPAGEIEGETYFCGLLYVPENWRDPDGRQIQITYAVLKSTSRSPLPDPVVYLEGGPGGSAIDGLSFWAEAFSEMRHSRDIILFDQRGTKYSSRLNCDPFQLALNHLLETDEELQELFGELLESADETVMSGVLAQVYMGACAEGLTELGYDLTQYNSRASVNDLFALTNALGYDEVNLYGISYGTRLALTAMRDHPAQIRSVVLDSSYPLQMNNLENMSNLLDEVLVGLVATCEADAECRAAFPDFGEQLGEVITAFAEDPDDLALLSAVLSAINQNPALAEYIPLMIDELSRGETGVLEGILEGEIPAEEAPEEQPGTPDQMLLQAEELQQSAQELFMAAALDAQEHRPGAQWVGQLLEALAPLSDEAQAEAAIELLAVTLGAPIPTTDALVEWAAEYLPDAGQAALLDDLGKLPAVELQYVYDLLNDASDELSESDGMTDGMYFSVECNEEFPYNDLTVTEQVTGSLTYPELGASGLAMAEQIAAVCAIWPAGQSTTIADRGVQSDIPTLVLSGAYDVQTPPSWNAMATEGLTNVTLVEAPASGHGVMLFSRCAANIAASFVWSPGIELNTACTADLAPDFVTPDEHAADAGDADETDAAGEREDDHGDTSDEDEPTGSREED